MVDILVFSPHPDDAELGCGGSILGAIKQGLIVAIADMTEGECATRGSPEQRRQEKEKATLLMQVSERISLNFPDTRIGAEESQRLDIIHLIRKMQPWIVLAPYFEDRHPDHGSAGRLISEACFYSGVKSVGTGLPYRPEGLFYYMIHTPFQPSFVMNISEEWEKKKEIFCIYASQFSGQLEEDEPTALTDPNFLLSQEARNRYYGAMIGVSFGEPFFSSGPLPAERFPLIYTSRKSNKQFAKYKLF
jgi:bacillithiol biosynthesis deacetylase BshB1